MLSKIIHLTAAVNQTFPIYIKAGLASHILFKQANHLNLYTATCLVYNMSETDRLARIGLEGFAAIDELFGRPKGRPPVRKVPIYYNDHQGNKIPATEVIDSNEAAQRYKGKVHTDYRWKPVPF